MPPPPSVKKNSTFVELPAPRRAPQKGYREPIARLRPHLAASGYLSSAKDSAISDTVVRAVRITPIRVAEAAPVQSP